MVKISTLINPLMIADKWVGFNGDSEFYDSNGNLQMGSWTFVGILDESDIESVDEKYGMFGLDDEIRDEDVFDNDYLIPVWDSNKQFVACIKVHYRSDYDE